jgi:RNA polymerase sigma factor (sigma-70 family)
MRKRLSKQGRRGAWRRWRREQAIVAQLPTVARVAREVSRMFARHIDVRDLAQAGTIGLVKAANSYDPAAGAFEPYAYFRIRGAIIDSQKRRTYREEAHVSLDSATGDRRYGRRVPGADERETTARAAERAELRVRLARAIAALPPEERYVLDAHLRGRTLLWTAESLGRGLRWTRTRLERARVMVGRMVRGKRKAA